MGVKDAVEIMADDRELAGEPDSNEKPVESLAKGRAHRSTAGKHMSALLDAEADDELALLFAEDEDDEEFASEPEEAEGEGETRSHGASGQSSRCAMRVGAGPQAGTGRA